MARKADPVDEGLRSRLVRDLGTVIRRCQANEQEGQELREHRDRVIRDALAAGLSAAEVAAETGLKTAEISKL